MKKLLALILVTLSLQVVANEKLLIQPQNISNQLLVNLLTRAEIRTIYGQYPGKSNFTAKMYRLPKIGSCLPNVSYICSADYYLVLSSLQKKIIGAVFYLGEVGKINSAKATKGENLDSAIIKIGVSNYPEYSELKGIRKTKSYNLYVSIESVDNVDKFIVNVK